MYVRTLYCKKGYTYKSVHYIECSGHARCTQCQFGHNLSSLHSLVAGTSPLKGGDVACHSIRTAPVASVLTHVANVAALPGQHSPQTQTGRQPTHPTGGLTPGCLVLQYKLPMPAYTTVRYTRHCPLLPHSVAHHARFVTLCTLQLHCLSALVPGSAQPAQLADPPTPSTAPDTGHTANQAGSWPPALMTCSPAHGQAAPLPAAGRHDMKRFAQGLAKRACRQTGSCSSCMPLGTNQPTTVLHAVLLPRCLLCASCHGTPQLLSPLLLHLAYAYMPASTGPALSPSAAALMNPHMI